MRISDWSSDVCSSDLGASRLRACPSDPVEPAAPHPDAAFVCVASARRFACVTFRQKTPREGHLRKRRNGNESGISAAAGSKDMGRAPGAVGWPRSEEHTSELQSLMRISYDVFCMKKK